MTQPIPPPPGSDSDDAAFVEVAPLYDMLMTGVPYEEWIVYLHKLLEERKAKPRHILDLACGTGNVSELLTQEGYKVTGVDIAPGMIAQARRKAEPKGLAIDYHVQDAALLELPGQRFDLCVSLFDSLNYITDPRPFAGGHDAGRRAPDAQRPVHLRSQHRVRAYQPLFRPEQPGSNDRLLYDWKSDFDPQTRLCRVQMQFRYRPAEQGAERVFEEVHWQFAYNQEEIVAMLENAGFDQITPYKAYTLRQPVRTSDRIFYVARNSG